MEREKKSEEQKELKPFLHRWLLHLDGWLHQVAAGLQAKTTPYSPQKMKRLLAGFCLLVSCLSGYFIIESVEENFSAFTITPIHTMPILKSSRVKPLIGEREGARIHRYKRYLDSLSGVQGKGAFLDSFRAVHPNFLDTLDYLENLYQQQLKWNTYEK